jgi:transcriptional regulator with XRE-family HTH domain
MANTAKPKTRVRGFVGQNVEQLLEDRGLRQDDLARVVREAGLGAWDQTVVSRLVKGSRALTLEESVVLAAALGVPLVQLLRGEANLLLGTAPVTAGQVRDVVTTGRVSSENQASTALDALSAAAGRPAGSITAQIAAELRTTEEKVERAAWKLWHLEVADELEVRMRESIKAYTGTDPGLQGMVGGVGVIQNLGTVLRLGQVDPRRRRAWQGHHIKDMTEEIAERVQKDGHRR